MIKWFANNGIAANLLMIGILLAGIHSAYFRVPLEVSPAYELNVVRMTISYPGATPKDIEKAILLPVEQALEGIKGVNMVNADAYRGNASFWIDADPGRNLQELMDDIDSRVRGITTFPANMEPPRLYIPDSADWLEVIKVAVTGNLSEMDLRRVALDVQDDLLELPGVSRVEIQGRKQMEISVELDQRKMEAYAVTFQSVANAIRQFSIDLPAGSIRSQSGELVIRTRGQAYSAEEFQKIPVRSANGSELSLSEIATIHDGFEENRYVFEFNGAPVVFIEVLRSGNESAIDVAKTVNEYVKSSKGRYPQGINLYTFEDESVPLRGRLNALTSSLVQGMVLVLVILGMFLRPQLAFWVVLGIPISFAGGVFMMPWLGVTGNIMSLFGFIIVVGVVVDDAIVTGENVFLKMKEGMSPLDAAIEGTREVATPVTFGVLTTIVAFVPLMFFEGRWGTFAKQIPPVVAPVLLFSLIESKFILPSHLKHLRLSEVGTSLFSRFQDRVSVGLETFVDKVYRPSLRWTTANRFSSMAIFFAMALMMVGYFQSGRLGYVSVPAVDKPKITAVLELPDDTSFEVTRSYIDRISATVDQLKSEFKDKGTEEPLVVNVLRMIGTHHPRRPFNKSHGVVSLELIPPSLRTVEGPRNSVILERWKELIGPIPEATSFRIFSEQENDNRERDSNPLELELRGPNSEHKNLIAREIANSLRALDGIEEAWARINEGQDELEFTLKPRAAELGITQQSLATQVRQSFFGAEAQRIVRDRDEVRVMVRLPKRQRESLHTLDTLKIATTNGDEVPISTIADVSYVRNPTFVERNHGAEVVRINATPENDSVNLMQVAEAIRPRIDELIVDHKELSYLFTGFVADAEESRKRFIVGAIGLAFALYTLLAIPFKSALQPLYILLAVPFGVIGALLGHMILGITPSDLSLFGMLAMAGVVVNDSLVMVDFINRQVREGVSLDEAVHSAGCRRFRPILLTSMTTFVGLMPLIFDNSVQAQFLIPMAVSLGFGVIFATIVTLYLIPCVLLVAEDFKDIWSRLWNWYRLPWSSNRKSHRGIAN